MSQTSDNSRTFRVLNLTDEVKTNLTNLKAVITQHENINYVEVANVSDIAAVKSVLDAGDAKYKQCSYSTFVRFKDQMSIDDLKTTAQGLCANLNILYSRVDENNHTGKLVVDRLEDYTTLKSNTGDVSFYRFSPLNVPRPQNRNYQGGENNNSNQEWQTVQARRPTVRGKYAQAVGSSAVTQAPVQSSAPATRGGATRGRGGSTRGRGGASRAAPAS